MVTRIDRDYMERFVRGQIVSTADSGDQCEFVLTDLQMRSGDALVRGGNAAFAAHRQELDALVPGAGWEVSLVLANDDMVAARWEVVAPARKDAPAIRVAAGGIGHLEDGQVKTWREIWDVLDLLRQRGAVEVAEYPGHL